MSTSASNPSLEDAIRDLGGDPEVAATWVATNRDVVRLVDIREPHELQGPLGNIPGVQNTPLLKVLGQGIGPWGAQPLVLICRSGRRSAMAAASLRKLGVNAVSVEGGMLAWNLDVEGRDDVVAQEKSANTQNLSEAVYRTNGLPEVSAQWVSDNVGRFRLVDVREPAEFAQHGGVAQAELIPLGTVMEQAQGFDREAPLVVMCASGRRSGRVVSALEAAGFASVASMEGGMFGWIGHRLPLAR